MKSVRFKVLLLVILLLASCQTSRLPVISQSAEVVVREVVRDSIITLPADSSIIRAWFECDSLNRVIMTELETHSGKTIQPSAVLIGNKFIATAKVDSQSIYLSWKERHRETATINTVIKEIPVEKLVYKKPKWLVWLSAIGGGWMLFSIISIILKLKK